MNNKEPIDYSTVFDGFANRVLAEFGQPSTNRLFHYTTADGLQGIIQKNNLRFSDARFVNDGSEITHGLNVFESELDKLMEGKSPTDRSYAANLKDMLLTSVPNYGSWIFCLCEDGNLLNQWRDYGKDVVSYCIEFDLDVMRSSNFFNFNATLFSLIYKPEIQTRVMSQLLSDLYKKFTSLGPITDDDLLNELTYQAAGQITWLIYRFKHPAFEAEKEVRFVAFQRTLKKSCGKPGFRASALGLVPFYEWKPNPVDGKEVKLPIRSITVGPSPHAEVALLALREFLMANDYDVTTTCSYIPIRR